MHKSQLDFHYSSLLYLGNDYTLKQEHMRSHTTLFPFQFVQVVVTVPNAVKCVLNIVTKICAGSVEHVLDVILDTQEDFVITVSHCINALVTTNPW